LLPPVVPVSEVCAEFGVTRKTFRVWERDGVVPAGATIEYHGTRYVLADKLHEAMESIARHRAGNRSTTS
jgi:hypothetical protein